MTRTRPTAPEPFQIQVAERELDDLQVRLGRTRVKLLTHIMIYWVTQTA